MEEAALMAIVREYALSIFESRIFGYRPIAIVINNNDVKVTVADLETKNGRYAQILLVSAVFHNPFTYQF